MLEELHGFLLVDKPAGISFAAVVKAIKRKFNLVKVGHGGSLDTMASGLLILLINDANKFVDQVMGADRAYEGILRLDYLTDTGDIHGRPLPKPDCLATLNDLRGDVFQTEPRFCAIRKDGAVEYEIVDTGDHPQFLAHVYKFDLTDKMFYLRASKGVIPRALAQDLGASIESIRRTEIGKFKVNDAIPFERLLETETKDFAACVLPLSKALL